MATIPSSAKAQIDGGVPPFLNAQMTRGAVLKKTFVYKSGTAATLANSTIQDIRLPEGCIIDMSSIALSHDGVGAGNYQLGIGIVDKNGVLVQNVSGAATLAATETAGEIVRNNSTTTNSPSGGLLLDPYQYVVDNGVYPSDITVDNVKELKQRYHFCLTVVNTAAIAANKLLTVSFDCIIP
jgi:hypothetical protein